VCIECFLGHSASFLIMKFEKIVGFSFPSQSFLWKTIVDGVVPALWLKCLLREDSSTRKANQMLHHNT
jgi:hypothetical protein